MALCPILKKWKSFFIAKLYLLLTCYKGMVKFVVFDKAKEKKWGCKLKKESLFDF